MPEISIIVPVYNGEKYINKCIEMIINQTFKDFELIIIDDGSTDKSADMCNEYARKDTRIKVISKKNQGTWAARNRGIDESIGKYIIFFDCDDWYEDDLLKEMYETIKGKDVDLVISGQTNVTVDESGETLKRVKVLNAEHHFNTKNEILDNYILLRKEEIGDTLWNKIYKSEIIKKYDLKFENYKRGEDTLFNVNYYQNIDKCTVIGKAFYSYRIENSNPVWMKYNENYLNIVSMENDAIISKLKEWGKYNKDAKEYQATHFIYRIIEYFYGVVASTKSNLSFKNKYIKVSELISSKEVQINLKVSNVNGKFNKLIIKLMKTKNIVLILFFIRLKLIHNNIQDHRKV
ncbi:MAG: glycosyltransferase family 2 protein [Clostridium sp.]|uniref:glycosyltransferase family 2 protein n=1 Tax=Clostridium sp. TaxID=1506 RepID=UPI003D6CF777